MRCSATIRPLGARPHPPAGYFAHPACTTPEPAVGSAGGPASVTGTRIGSYEVAHVIARGGMAVVYLAHQAALDRDVALKRLNLDEADPTAARRFVGEARLAASLDHANVVTLFDF